MIFPVLLVSLINISCQISFTYLTSIDVAYHTLLWTTMYSLSCSINTQKAFGNNCIHFVLEIHFIPHPSSSMTYPSPIALWAVALFLLVLFAQSDISNTFVDSSYSEFIFISLLTASPGKFQSVFVLISLEGCK